MILNETVTGIIAVVLGYLIGSIPSAYFVTRLAIGKDIRQIGTGHTGVGNMGTRNVFVNVGKLSGVIVAILDILKGIGAVALARFALDASLFFVLGAGLAAVVGHIWPIYLKFRGGAGLATTIGVLGFLMVEQVAIALSLCIIFILITRNVVLSATISVLLIPILLWQFNYPWYIILFPVLLIVVMLIHFLPNIVAEFKKAGSMENLLAGLLRRGKEQTK